MSRFCPSTNISPMKATPPEVPIPETKFKSQTNSCLPITELEIFFLTANSVDAFEFGLGVEFGQSHSKFAADITTPEPRLGYKLSRNRVLTILLTATPLEFEQKYFLPLEEVYNLPTLAMFESISTHLFPMKI